MRRVLVLLCLLSSCPTWGRAQSTSYEEAYVREAYARLTYLTQIAAVSDKALEASMTHRVAVARLNAEVNARQALFTLSNFRVGELSEIGTVPWGEAITPAAKLDAVLVTSLGQQVYTSPEADPATWPEAGSRWDSPNYELFAESSSWYNKSVSETVSLVGDEFTVKGAKYTRYASFSIQTSFQSRVIGPYQAVFLFGKNAKGEEVVSAHDSGNQGFSLEGLFRLNLYPTGLVSTRLRQSPAIVSWLMAHAVTRGECTREARSFCCSAATCGLPLDVLEKDLNAPLTKAQPDLPNKE